MFFFILGHIYTSHHILKEIADIKGTEIIYTRESEKDILKNNTWKIRTLCSATFYLLLAFSIIYGYLGGSKVGGAFYLFLALAVPLLILRFGEMKNQKKSKNRDKIIADKILSAHKESKSILAVVGKGHLKGIQKHLPNEIDVKVEGPEYKGSSITHLMEITLPVFTAFSVLYVIYLLVLWLSTRMMVLM